MRHVRNILLVLVFFALPILAFIIIDIYFAIVDKAFNFGLNLFEKYVDYSQWPPAVLIALSCAYVGLFTYLVSFSGNTSQKKKKASKNSHKSPQKRAQKNENKTRFDTNFGNK